MTISSTNRKAGPYTGNGVATAFPFSFKVFGAADLLVVRTDLNGTETVLVLTTDYGVALNADQNANPGGTINLPGALTTGYLLTVSSKLDYLQTTDLFAWTAAVIILSLCLEKIVMRIIAGGPQDA